MAFSAYLSRFFGKTPVSAFDCSPGDVTARIDSGVQAAALRNSDAVYDLLGASSDAGHNAATYGQDDSQAATAPDDIIRRLHDQYCKAIASSRVSLTGEWVGSRLAAGYDTTRQPWEAYDRNDGANGSIADLLSDIEGLEEAFGPLFHGESRELMMPESTPEILQLFAPPEVHATASRRSVSLPPSLAQREHRSLAIDSPMAVLNTASFAQRESTE